MSYTNYTDLQASVAGYLGRSDLTTEIPDFIRFAELRLGRELRTRQMLNSATAPMIANSLEIQPITKSLSVDGIQIGMSEDYVLQFLGQPNERLPNQYGYEWFVYAGDYTRFKLLGIKEKTVFE